MVKEDEILRENEKQANCIVAKVMFVTFIIFTVVYLFNRMGLFVIDEVIMTISYIVSGVLLLLPTVLTHGLKIERNYVKYINVISAVLFVTIISITLNYHVVVIYVYPIAVASLYFSKKVNVIATIFTTVCISIGQIIAYYVTPVIDDNFNDLYEMIMWAIIPRAMILVAIAVIFTMLCTRTVALLSNLIHAVEAQTKYHNEMVIGYATLVENRDGSTGGHIKRTSLYVKLLAETLKRRGLYEDILTKEYMENLVKAAPMHDIGKISIPDSVLQKPGRLTDEEYNVMKQHAARGGEIIRNTFGHMEDEAYTQMAYEVARFHHEKWNGKGYPDGLKGEEIPLAARIMAIADVFDAISEKRCYRDAMPLDKCFDIIREGSGQDFDPRLVEVFLDIRDDVEKVHHDAGKGM